MLYLQGAFTNGGKGLQDTIQKLQDQGAAITPELIEATQKLSAFTNTIDLAKTGFANSFGQGFADALGGMDQLGPKLAKLNPLFEGLGNIAGTLFNKFVDLVAKATEIYKSITDWWHSREATDEKAKEAAESIIPAIDGKPKVNSDTGIGGPNADAVNNANASGDKFYNAVGNAWDWAKGVYHSYDGQGTGATTSTDTSTNNTFASQASSGFLNSQVGYKPTVPNINVNTPPAQVNLDFSFNDPQLRSLITMTAREVVNAQFQSSVLGLNSAQSSGGF